MRTVSVIICSMERWHTFPQYCMETFGKKLYKVPLDAHMTCPNRDGTKGTGGCIFCSGRGSGEFALSYDGQILKKEDLVFNHMEAPEGSYIAYFQSFTNTYAPVQKLEQLYRPCLENPLFAGISIATRPDCLPEETLQLLRDLRKQYPDKFIWAELGLQSMHEKSALWMNRCYPLQVFDDSVRNLQDTGIDVIAHVIIGIPQETEEDLLATIAHLNELGVNGIKLHLLHYLSDSRLGRQLKEAPDAYHILSMEEYVSLVCACIGHLDPDIVIHRLTGDGDRNTLLAPLWANDKRRVINSIRHELKVRDITQGSLRKQ